MKFDCFANVHVFTHVSISGQMWRKKKDGKIEKEIKRGEERGGGGRRESSDGKLATIVPTMHTVHTQRVFLNCFHFFFPIVLVFQFLE